MEVLDVLEGYAQELEALCAQRGFDLQSAEAEGRSAKTIRRIRQEFEAGSRNLQHLRGVIAFAQKGVWHLAAQWIDRRLCSLILVDGDEEEIGHLLELYNTHCQVLKTGRIP